MSCLTTRSSPERQRALTLFLTLVTVLVSCRRTGPPAVEQAAGADPSLRTGKLENGLRYWLRRHPDPAGKLALRLYLAAGRVHEGSDELGAAHFVEHLAFNGTENFAPRAAEQYLRSLGMKLGRDLNGTTGLDSTVYRLLVPAREEELKRGLLFLGDVSRRISFAPVEIDREREVLVSEERDLANAADPTRERLFSLFAAGSKVAASIAVPAEAIRNITREQLVRFYRRCYRPDSVTLLAVGDVDLERMEQLIAAEFGDWRAPPAGPAPPPLVRETQTEPRASVVPAASTQPLTVSLNWVEPAAPLATPGELDRWLMESLGLDVVHGRLGARVRADFPAASVSVYARRRFGHRLTRVIVQSPDAQRWPALLGLMAAEVQRARKSAPDGQEWAASTSGLRRAAENQVRQEPQSSSESIMEEMLTDLGEGGLPQSAAGESAQVLRLLKSRQPQAVPKTLAQLWSPGRVGVLLEIADTAARPQPGEVLSVLQRALDAEVPETAPHPSGSSANAGLPPPPKHKGTVTTQDKSTGGVVSATLSNALHLRLLSMDTPNDRVILSVRVERPGAAASGPRGALEERLSRALARPRTASHSSEEVRRYVQNHGLLLTAAAAPDSVQMRLIARPDAFEPSLRLLYHLLSSGRIDAGIWNQARVEADLRAQARQDSPGHHLDQATWKALGIASTRGPERPATLEAAQGALAEALRGGGIEVAVVGEVPVETMLAQSLASLGGLAERPTPRRKPMAPPPAPARGPWPSTLKVTGAKSAMVRLGWPGPTMGQLQDQRALRAAARVLTTRLHEEIREKRGLTYAIEANVAPVPGSNASWMGTTFEVAPERAPTALDAARAIFQEFAATGPSQAELDTARAELKMDVERAQASADYWAGVLLGLEARGVSLSELERAAEANAQLTASTVKQAMSRYLTDRARFELLVTAP